MVTLATQTITFAPLSNQAYGSTAPALSATASSGLTVGFNSQTPLVCKVSGTTVTLLAIGTCTIQATQSGNADYSAAAPVSRSFTVTVASQTITFGPLSNQTYGSTPPALSATTGSGLSVGFNSQTPLVCKVSGTTVTLLAIGTCTVQATQSGNGDYAAARRSAEVSTVTTGSQTITFAPLSNQAYGSTAPALSATASSGLAVSFNSQTLPVCKVSGTTMTLLAPGTCNIQATQSGNADYAAAAPVSRSFTVTTGSQTITFAPLSNQGLWLDAPA